MDLITRIEVKAVSMFSQVGDGIKLSAELHALSGYTYRVRVGAYLDVTVRFLIAIHDILHWMMRDRGFCPRKYAMIFRKKVKTI